MKTKPERKLFKKLAAVTLILAFCIRGDIYGNRVLPMNLKYKSRWDWPLGFRWVPRCWTAYDWGVPKQVCGNQKSTRIDHKTGIKGPAPIGEYGSWQVSRYPKLWGPFHWIPLVFTCTLPNGRHFRAGARWDDVDSYSEFPGTATRHYEKNGDTDTDLFSKRLKEKL